MKIENNTLSNLLLKFNFKEVNKKFQSKRFFKKTGLYIIINGPNITYSNNVYDYNFSESNIVEELASVIYYTQLPKKERDILTEKLNLGVDGLKNIYPYLKSETELYPRYTLLSEHYIKIAKLRNEINELIKY